MLFIKRIKFSRNNKFFFFFQRQQEFVYEDLITLHIFERLSSRREMNLFYWTKGNKVMVDIYRKAHSGSIRYQCFDWIYLKME